MMIRRLLSAVFLTGLLALAGCCHTDQSTSRCCPPPSPCCPSPCGTRGAAPAYYYAPPPTVNTFPAQ
jgi:hypothetical protein